MKSFISIIIIFVFVFNSFSQETQYIYLKNVENNKEKYIKENRKVHIHLKDSTELDGRFRILNDTTIIVKNDTISINDIKLIKRKGFLLPGIILTALGSTIAIYGGLGCYCAIVFYGSIMGDIGLKFGPPLLIIGAIPTIIGIQFLILNQRYKTDKWDMKIMTEKEIEERIDFRKAQAK